MSAAILSKYIKPDVLSHIGKLKFKPSQLVEGSLAGAHRSPRHGFAVEFAAHREYAPGDDVKHLDWNVYFRRDKFFIKQYEMETNLVCHLWLDISASMRYGEKDMQKMNYAAELAATLAYLIVNQSDKVAFATYDNQVRNALNPSNAMQQVLRMTSTLNDIDPVHETSIEQAMLELAGRTRRREIVIILSDCFVDLEELRHALQRLKAARHEVVLMQVMHPDELHFDLDGTVRFEGLESSNVMLTRPEDVRTTYLNALKAFDDELEAVCDAHGCERLVCETGRPMGELFADYLMQRQLYRNR